MGTDKKDKQPKLRYCMIAEKRVDPRGCFGCPHSHVFVGIGDEDEKGM